MNLIYDQKEIDALQGIIDIVKTYNNPPTGPDGPIKWASIMQAINALSFDGEFTKVLDIGAGNSVLPLMIADQGFDVTAIDKHALNQSVLDDKRIESKIIDAFEYLESVPDNSLEIIVDSCAAIHFNFHLWDDGDHTDFRVMNSGCIHLAQLLSQKLKKGGLFITVTDFALSNGDSEFMTLNNLLDCYEKYLDLQYCYPILPTEPLSYRYDPYDLGITRLVFSKI